MADACDFGKDFHFLVEAIPPDSATLFYSRYSMRRTIKVSSWCLCSFVKFANLPTRSTTSSPLSTSITEPKPTSTLPPQTPTSLSTSPTPSDSTSSTPNQATPKTSSTSAQSSQDSVAGPIETSSSDSAADTSTAAVHGGSPIVSVNATHGATTFTGPSAIKQSSSSSISSSQPASGPSQSVNAPYAKSQVPNY